jgi:hypothetical protein
MTRRYMIAGALALLVLAGFMFFRSMVSAPIPTRSILLYLYDANKDKDTAGNIMCGRQGLVAVSRQIPVTKTPIKIPLICCSKVTFPNRRKPKA